MKEEELLVHYGSYPVSIEKFKRIQDSWSIIQKPFGGLWVSPVNSGWGWIDWCISEGYPAKTSVRTTLRLKEGAKLLKIDSLEDLIEVFRRYATRGIISFEAIENDKFDGVYLTEKGNDEVHLPLGSGPNLYAWDCESMVLFNLDCVDIVEIK